MTLAIVTPSGIHSQARARLAEQSLKSLRDAVGPDYPHIVVDDYPRGRTWLTRWFADRGLRDCADRIYSQPNTTLIRRRGRSSAAALLLATREARRQGAQYVFIHLDDNVYVAVMGELFHHAAVALAHDPALVKVRLAGYPVLWAACTQDFGNRSTLHIDGDCVSFDRTSLQPTPHDDFTLWWTELNEDMIGEKSYPIVFWSVIYRVEFLESLLTYRPALGRGSLADVERFYLDPANWHEALKTFSGKLGYINMQFGGIEMEHNKNWEELLRVPNQPVR